jgi:hypothetical protein
MLFDANCLDVTNRMLKRTILHQWVRQIQRFVDSRLRAQFIGGKFAF